MSERFRRARLLSSIVEAVGNTPLVRLDRLARSTPGVEVYLKLEYHNPGGSVKDRPALRIIEDAIADGRFTKERRLIDATSGNTGVAYSLMGAALGRKVTLVMPSNVSQARREIARAFGTELVFSDPMLGTDGAIQLARRMVEEAPDRYFYADQYSNPSNPLAHYHGTGGEILDALGDRLTHFVAGVGTSGTLMGTTRRLKQHSRPVRCIGVEPAESLHGLEGMKHMATSIVPPIFDPRVPDEIMSITTDEGWDMAERAAVEEGLYVGHSTGANLCAALKVAARAQSEGGSGCVVTIACDRADRYFSQLRWERRYTW